MLTKRCVCASNSSEIGKTVKAIGGKIDTLARATRSKSNPPSPHCHLQGPARKQSSVNANIVTYITFLSPGYQP